MNQLMYVTSYLAELCQQSWEEGSMAKVLAWKTCEPEFA